MQTSFDFYADPGHGWLKAPLKLIKELGLENFISHFSYINKQHVFLEEDCDAGRLIVALRERGHKVTFREHHGDKRSRIRGYCSYDPTKINWNECRVKGQGW